MVTIGAEKGQGVPVKVPQRNNGFWRLYITLRIISYLYVFFVRIGDYKQSPDTQ